MTAKEPATASSWLRAPRARRGPAAQNVAARLFASESSAATSMAEAETEPARQSFSDLMRQGIASRRGVVVAEEPAMADQDEDDPELDYLISLGQSVLEDEATASAIRAETIQQYRSSGASRDDLRYHDIYGRWPQDAR